MLCLENSGYYFRRTSEIDGFAWHRLHGIGMEYLWRCDALLYPVLPCLLDAQTAIFCFSFVIILVA